MNNYRDSEREWVSLQKEAPYTSLAVGPQLTVSWGDFRDIEKTGAGFHKYEVVVTANGHTFRLTGVGVRRFIEALKLAEVESDKYTAIVSVEDSGG